MRTPRYILFDLHRADELEEGMDISICMDIGTLYGTVSSTSYDSKDEITIIVNNIRRDPSEEPLYAKNDSITISSSPEMLFKVRISIPELFKRL